MLMSFIVRIQTFEADLGVAKATGSLFVADPMEDSFIQGTLNVLQLENVSLEARVKGPPIRIDVLRVTGVISFEPIVLAFHGI